jgi:predicted ester cyclase
MRGVTRDDIFALLARRTAAWIARDPVALAALHAPDGVVASPTGGALEGRDEIERVYRLWMSAFPDITTHEATGLVDGDRAVQVLRFTGTHAGEFFGLPATGRHVEVLVACVMTLSDGFITEERRIYDFTGVLVQVGVLKAKPGA